MGGTVAVTEDEAKTKSCCGPMQAEYGRQAVVNCIGTACMAWNWDGDAAEWTNLPLTQLPEGAGWFQPQPPGRGDTHVSWKRVSHGFCGLARKS